MSCFHIIFMYKYFQDIKNYLSLQNLELWPQRLLQPGTDVSGRRELNPLPDVLCSWLNLCSKIFPFVILYVNPGDLSFLIIFIMFLKGQVCFLFLDPQDEVGPSISFSVVLCSFVLLVYIVVLVLVVCLCPSSVRVVATFSGTVLFLYYVLYSHFLPNTLITLFVVIVVSQFVTFQTSQSFLRL